MARNLKLEVLLKAVDKVTAPLKNIRASTGDAAKAIEAARKELKGLEAAQKNISAFRDLKRQAQGTSETLKGNTQRITELTRAINSGAGNTKQLTAEKNKLIRASQTLGNKHTEELQKLNALRNSIRTTDGTTGNLANRNQQLSAQIARVNKQLEQQQGALRRTAQQQRKLAEARDLYDKRMGTAGKMAGVGASSLATGAATGMPVLGLIKSHMSFEDAMAGVAKQVDAARDDNGQLTDTYYQIADAIKEISTRIPMASTEIAALIEGGARMGIQGKEELLKFAEVAANAATAFEIPADKIGEDLARIAGLFNVPINELDKLGDVINYLDDGSLAKGSDLIESITRLADLSDKMDFRDVSAFAGTFLSMGRRADTAATATRAMVRELGAATMRGNTFQHGMDMLGLNSETIQKKMSIDATGTLIEVLEKLDKVRPEQQMEVAERLFGKEFAKDATALSQNLDMLRKHLNMTRSSDAEGSMQVEADIRAELLSSRLTMSRNRINNLADAMGETLKPTILKIINAFDNVIGRVNSWVKANPKLTGQILKIVAGAAILATTFGAIVLSLAGLTLSFAVTKLAITLLIIKGKALLISLKSIATGVLMLGKFLMTSPLFLAIGLIAAAAYLIYKNWDSITTKLKEIWAAFGAWWADKSAVLAQDWAFITEAVAELWDSLWGGITGGVAAIWNEITTAFDGGIVGVSALLLDWSPLGIFYKIFQPVLGWFGIELPEKFSEFGSNMIEGLVNGITNMAGAAKDAISNVGSNVTNWFKEKLGINSPSRVFAELGVNTLEGYEQGLDAQENSTLKQVQDFAKDVADTGMVFSNQFTAADFDTAPPVSAPASRQAAGDNYTYQFNITGSDPKSIANQIELILRQRDAEKERQGRAILSDRYSY